MDKGNIRAHLMLKGIIIDFNIVQIKFVNLSKKWNLIKSDELSIISF